MDTIDDIIDSKVGKNVPGVAPINLDDHLQNSSSQNEQDDNDDDNNKPSSNTTSLTQRIPIFTITKDDDGNIYQEEGGGSNDNKNNPRRTQILLGKEKEAANQNININNNTSPVAIVTKNSKQKSAPVLKSSFPTNQELTTMPEIFQDSVKKSAIDHIRKLFLPRLLLRASKRRKRKLQQQQSLDESNASKANGEQQRSNSYSSASVGSTSSHQDLVTSRSLTVDVIRSIPLFAHWNPATIESALLPNARLRRFAPGEVIDYAGDPSRRRYLRIVMSGLVSCSEVCLPVEDGWLHGVMEKADDRDEDPGYGARMVQVKTRKTRRGATELRQISQSFFPSNINSSLPALSMATTTTTSTTSANQGLIANNNNSNSSVMEVSNVISNSSTLVLRLPHSDGFMETFYKSSLLDGPMILDGTIANKISRSSSSSSVLRSEEMSGILAKSLAKAGLIGSNINQIGVYDESMIGDNPNISSNSSTGIHPALPLCFASRFSSLFLPTSSTTSSFMAGNNSAIPGTSPLSGGAANGNSPGGSNNNNNQINNNNNNNSSSNHAHSAMASPPSSPSPFCVNEHAFLLEDLPLLRNVVVLPSHQQPQGQHQRIAVFSIDTAFVREGFLQQTPQLRDAITRDVLDNIKKCLVRFHRYPLNEKVMRYLLKDIVRQPLQPPDVMQLMMQSVHVKFVPSLSGNGNAEEQHTGDAGGGGEVEHFISSGTSSTLAHRTIAVVLGNNINKNAKNSYSNTSSSMIQIRKEYSKEEIDEQVKKIKLKLQQEAEEAAKRKKLRQQQRILSGDYGNGDEEGGDDDGDGDFGPSNFGKKKKNANTVQAIRPPPVIYSTLTSGSLIGVERLYHDQEALMGKKIVCVGRNPCCLYLIKILGKLQSSSSTTTTASSNNFKETISHNHEQDDEDPDQQRGAEVSSGQQKAPTASATASAEWIPIVDDVEELFNAALISSSAVVDASPQSSGFIRQLGSNNNNASPSPSSFASMFALHSSSPSCSINFDQFREELHLQGSTNDYAPGATITTASEVADRAIVIKTGTAVATTATCRLALDEAIGFVACLVPHRWAMHIVAVGEVQTLEFGRDAVRKLAARFTDHRTGISLLDVLTTAAKTLLFPSVLYPNQVALCIAATSIAMTRVKNPLLHVPNQETTVEQPVIGRRNQPPHVHKSENNMNNNNHDPNATDILHKKDVQLHEKIMERYKTRSLSSLHRRRYDLVKMLSPIMERNDEKQRKSDEQTLKIRSRNNLYGAVAAAIMKSPSHHHSNNVDDSPSSPFTSFSHVDIHVIIDAMKYRTERDLYDREQEQHRQRLGLLTSGTYSDTTADLNGSGAYGNSNIGASCLNFSSNNFSSPTRKNDRNPFYSYFRKHRAQRTRDEIELANFYEELLEDHLDENTIDRHLTKFLIVNDLSAKFLPELRDLVCNGMATTMMSENYNEIGDDNWIMENQQRRLSSPQNNNSSVARVRAIKKRLEFDDAGGDFSSDNKNSANRSKSVVALSPQNEIASNSFIQATLHSALGMNLLGSPPQVGQIRRKNISATAQKNQNNSEIRRASSIATASSSSSNRNLQLDNTRNLQRTEGSSKATSLTISSVAKISNINNNDNNTFNGSTVNSIGTQTTLSHLLVVNKLQAFRKLHRRKNEKDLLMTDPQANTADPIDGK